MDAANITSFGNGFLESLTFQDLGALAPFLHPAKLAKDQHLYQQGEPIEWIYFPVSAVVSKFGILDDGSTIEIAMTGAEGAVGLASTVGHHGAINHIQVLSGGSTFRIGSSQFGRAMAQSPGLNHSVADLLNAQLRHMSKRMACSRFHSVEQRVSLWLLMLRERSKDVRMPVTHEQIARALGVHRPTVTELTTSMRDRGLIAYSRGRVTLLNLDEIRKLSCDCFDDLSIGSSRT